MTNFSRWREPRGFRGRTRPAADRSHSGEGRRACDLGDDASAKPRGEGRPDQAVPADHRRRAGYHGDPSVDRLTVEGPFNPTGAGDTASRAANFRLHSAKPEGGAALRAQDSPAGWSRRAYRRPLRDTDLETLLSFYQRRRNANGSFEAGIESALQFILASPEFLFRFEPDPAMFPGNGVSRRRPGAGFAPVVLFVEQHRPTTNC